MAKFSNSGGQTGGNNGASPTILTLPANFTTQIGEQVVSGLGEANVRDQAYSVLLPPAQDQKVMIIGGGILDTTASCYIADLKASTPVFAVAAPMSNKRMHHHAILLPDRTVFVCGGSGGNENIDLSELPPELYNPATNTWTTLERPSIRGRVYHSTAILLPDGRIALTGGNPSRGTVEPRIEIYSPPYINQTRPGIQSAPTLIRYNSGSMVIQTTQAADIKWAQLVRPIATTHTCDTEQRVVDLPITNRNTTSITVQVTNNRNLAPPGWYMLFIVDNNNVPSVARWIQLVS
ncbi:MAG: DUF1929 domain-containing protein [Calothrix sp. SM1_7_51]|nr:DUF1929 domain-containing protein [Calothrix sp. SM1_7_51]